MADLIFVLACLLGSFVLVVFVIPFLIMKFEGIANG